MAWDFKFDPQTQDLIDDGAGAIETTDTAETMVMHQLLCHLGEWWGDETLGSKIHDLNAFQSRPEVLAPDEAKRALGVLIDRGRIANLEVRAEMQGQGRVVVLARFQDASTGQLVDTFAKAGR